MLNRQRQDWQAFAAAAKAKGFCTLAIDMRGHGSSISGPGGQKLAWKSFSDAQFQGILKDIQAAHDYLLKQKNVDPNAVGVVGASIGANLSVMYAAQHPGQIKSVVLLSPGQEYHGVKPADAIRKYPGKMLFYASPGDDYSYKSVEAFIASAKDRAMFMKMEGDGHGTQLLKQYPEQVDHILAWLAQNL
jgi:pimeloyl-ACP methyl ester carboxylesterase